MTCVTLDWPEKTLTKTSSCVKGEQQDLARTRLIEGMEVYDFRRRSVDDVYANVYFVHVEQSLGRSPGNQILEFAPQ